MREDAQLRTALSLLASYTGKPSLPVFLKNSFREHPNMGSRDRRLYTAAIYAYYRMGKALPDLPREQRIAIGAFLSGISNQDFFTNLYTRYSLEGVDADLEQRLLLISKAYPAFKTTDLYPFLTNVSRYFNAVHLQHAILVQPLVWIRVKKSQQLAVQAELEKNAIPYQIDASMPQTVSFASGVSLTKLQSFEKGYFEIQDRSSQESLSILPALKNSYAWDVCAGSGGKSLQLADTIEGLKLFCTDVRKSILDNLQIRFRKAGVKNFSLFEADLAVSAKAATGKKFDLIVADVPCSGSGTWARNPDRVSFFDKKEMERYQALQQGIISNALPTLKSGGYFVYITCSVFKQENEGIVDAFAKEHGLSILSMQGIGAEDFTVDKLFVALLQKP